MGTSRRNSDVEFLNADSVAAILKKSNAVVEEVAADKDFFRENDTTTDTDAESFKSAKSTLTTPAMVTPEPFENNDFSKIVVIGDNKVNDIPSDILSDSSLLKTSEKTKRLPVSKLRHANQATSQQQYHHIKPVGDVTSKQCMQCSQNKFAKRLHLVTHLRKEHDLKVKFCKHCNFIFKQKDFKKHVCCGKQEKDGEISKIA